MLSLSYKKMSMKLCIANGSWALILDTRVACTTGVARRNTLDGNAMCACSPLTRGIRGSRGAERAHENAQQITLVGGSNEES